MRQDPEDEYQALRATTLCELHTKSVLEVVADHPDGTPVETRVANAKRLIRELVAQGYAEVAREPAAAAEILYRGPPAPRLTRDELEAFLDGDELEVVRAAIEAGDSVSEYAGLWLMPTAMWERWHTELHKAVAAGLDTEHLFA